MTEQPIGHIVGLEGARTPVYLGHFRDLDGSKIHVTGYRFVGEPTTPPPAQLRDPFIWPFAVDSIWNTPTSTSAVFASATDAATKAVNDRASGGVVNRATWSIATAKASASDPIVTVKRPGTGGAVWTTVQGKRVPANFSPPLGTNGAADANSSIVQPDYFAFDAYKFARESTNVWASTFVVVYDIFGSGIFGGIRASGFATIGGLMRDFEVAQINTGELPYFPHALAAAWPKEILKRYPTASDGEVLGTGGVAVFPANRQDNQANVPYGTTNASGVWTDGSVPMGTAFGLLPTFNLDTWRISGAVPTRAQRAFAETLIRFPVYTSDQAGSMALFAEPTSNSTVVNSLTTAWKSLIPSLRRITNQRSTAIAGGPAPRILGTPAAPPLIPRP